MQIDDLKKHLIDKVPNFENPETIEEGEGYHYTKHWKKINKLNKFKGAKINEDLDCTQNINYMGEATEDNGVVFAYENIEDAKEEGFGLDIIKIKFRQAIKAIQKSEEELDKFTGEIAMANGLNLAGNPTPHTLLILVEDIISFEFVEKAN